MDNFYFSIQTIQSLVQNGSFSNAFSLLNSMLQQSNVGSSHELSHLFYTAARLFDQVGQIRFSVSPLRNSYYLETEQLKKSTIKSELLNILNPYGMVKSKNGEDDLRAFISVQTSLYLSHNQKESLCSVNESERLLDQIWNLWDIQVAKDSRDLSDYDDKIDYYYRVGSSSRSRQIDFVSRKPVTLFSSCSCASGLPFYACCGGLTDPVEYYSVS